MKEKVVTQLVATGFFYMCNLIQIGGKECSKGKIIKNSYCHMIIVHSFSDQSIKLCVVLHQYLAKLNEIF